MNKLLLTLEEALPHWLGTPQLQWAQWVYGIWQVVRRNPLPLFVLSWPVYLWQIYYKKKRIVVVGETQDYMMSLKDMSNHQWRTLTIEKYEYGSEMCFLKYGEYYYYAHTDSLRELAECERQFGEDVVFVEKLLPITDEVSAGKKISQTEAYEKILSSKGYHISRVPPCVAPSLLDYVDVSSKFWGVLSIIPIILQAKSYNRVSTLLSFVVIVLDLNRHWLYRIYDDVFDKFAKFVKLHIFKKRKYLYHIFSLFSSRWNYAYMILPEVSIRIRPDCKLKSMEDLQIHNDFQLYGEAPRIDKLCVEMDKDRAYVSLMQNNVLYTKGEVKWPVYVPALKLQWPAVGHEREFLTSPSSILSTSLLAPPPSPSRQPPAPTPYPYLHFPPTVLSTILLPFRALIDNRKFKSFFS